jgi:hypothetical protein
MRVGGFAKIFYSAAFFRLNMGFLKCFPLLLAFLFAASLLLVAAQPILAQTPHSATPTPTPTSPKPAVPQFTVKLTNTEQNQTTITLTIKNQPFDNNTYPYSFVYNVQIKTDNADWIALYDAEDGYPTMSNSNYTVLSYVPGQSAYYPPEYYPLSPSTRVGVLPASGAVDFQVEAMIGHRDRGAFVNGTMPYVFKGETSGWSTTQTVNLSQASSITPALEPTATSTSDGVFSFLVAVFVAVVVVVLAIVLFFYFRKTPHPSNLL